MRAKSERVVAGVTGICGLALAWAAILAVAAAFAKADALDDALTKFSQAPGVVRTVSQGREIHLWHWTTFGEVIRGKTDRNNPEWRPYLDEHGNPKPLEAMNDRRVRSYLRYPLDEYRDGRGSGAAGAGVYLATDPIVTAYDYGMSRSPDWVVIQLKLPTGAKFLDALAQYATFDQTLVSLVRQQGCGAYDLTSLFASHTFPACRKVRNRLVEMTGIVAVRYRYGSQQIHGCGSRPPGAFVFVDRGDRFDDEYFWNKALVFGPRSDQAGDGHGEMRLIIQELFARASKVGLPWKSLQGKKPENTNMDEWMKKNILSCSAGLPED